MTNFEKIVELLAIESIIERLSCLEKEEMIRKLQDLEDLVYPFSDYEFIISNLLWLDKMSLEEYENMREEYIGRNRHLDKFQMAWKNVGKWAEDIMIDWLMILITKTFKGGWFELFTTNILWCLYGL